MTYDLQKIAPRHQVVARYLALGLKLKEICEGLGLNYNSWAQITQGSLFQSEIQRYQAELEEDFLSRGKEDPIYIKLRAGAGKSVDTLVRALEEGESEGGTAGSRISAANSILDRLGYSQKEKETKPVIVINLAPEKLSRLQHLSDLLPQPDLVTA